MNITLIKDLKENCKLTKDCFTCKNRELCKDWLTVKGRYTPSNSDINDMFLHFNKNNKSTKETSNNQIFTNDFSYGYTKNHKSRNFYNRLKFHFCIGLGYKMCEEWLNYQEFCKYWDMKISEGYTKPKFNKDCDLINEISVKFV